MKTIICGSRGITERTILWRAMRGAELIGIKPSVIVSGHCPRSPDMLGEEWARDHGIPVELHRAEWDRYGARAGMLRNVVMGDISDAVIALWDGKSPGTKHMIEHARKRNLRVLIHIAGTDEFYNGRYDGLPDFTLGFNGGY